MRIAYFSPLNPIKTGVSDYTEELLPYLSRYADIDLYIDNYQPSNKEIITNFNIFHYLSYGDRQDDYDITLYHIGNNPAHTYIYNSLMKYPGVVVLHDYILHHLALKALVDSGNWEEYIDEMKECYGDEGVLASIQILKGYGRDTLYFLYPFNERLLTQAAGVIVHSEYLKRKIQNKCPSLPVFCVNQGIKLWPEKEINAVEAKKKRGLEKDTFIVASFGLITIAKRPETIIKAFKSFHNKHKNSILLLVGKVADTIDLNALLEKYSLKKSVKITGYVDFASFQEYISMSDVCLNLRYPSGGETSAALLRIMACGKLVFVSNYSQFAELPDDCCVKIDLGKNEVAELIAYLNLLYEDSNVRSKIGCNAKEYIKKNHTLESSAKLYAECLTKLQQAMKSKRTAGRQKLRENRRNFGEKLLAQLMGKMADLGVADNLKDTLSSLLSDLDIMPS
jgi:glycosyltransferase involved in cell wall biosynthesis